MSDSFNDTSNQSPREMASESPDSNSGLPEKNSPSSEMKIEICMGSSCFARGNEKNLQVIEEFIDSQAISCTVDLVGKRCENLCCDGPNIRINGVRFQGVDRGMILDILEKSVRNS